MSGLGSFFNNLSSALSANNVSAAATAAAALQSALGVSQAVTAKATMYINNFNLAQASNNPAGMAAAANGLIAMSDQLPYSIQPLIAELNNPAIIANPAMSAGVVAQIQTALVHSSLL